MQLHPFWVVLQAGCTTIVVPGWAAIAVVGIAAAPRLFRTVLQGGSGGE